MSLQYPPEDGRYIKLVRISNQEAASGILLHSIMAEESCPAAENS